LPGASVINQAAPEKKVSRMKKQTAPKRKAAPVARCGLSFIGKDPRSVGVLFSRPGQILSAGADVLAQTLHGAAGRETRGGDGKK
jgi:hypothetical protein